MREIILLVIVGHRWSTCGQFILCDILFHHLGPGLVSQRRARSQELRGDDYKYIEREHGAQYTTDPDTGDLHVVLLYSMRTKLNH